MKNKKVCNQRVGYFISQLQFASLFCIQFVIFTIGQVAHTHLHHYFYVLL